jgi:alkanesulfonate monooxygenase SsuD/methylene tetrahydromethanopterin reductase-like flavin-dependent oxidoreductase (luciferase family)
MRLSLRYDMRQPDPDAQREELYQAAIEQCAWADRLGFDAVYIGEHHGAEDGYIPSSIVLASAIAARTQRLKLHLSALVITMHHPLRLAEDIAVLDLVSNGRVYITAGMGYRPHEFEMLGVDFKKRLQTYLNTIDVLQKAWTGEPFDFEGRTVRVMPKPVQKGGPKIIMGGSTEASAERAAKLGLDYMPGHPGLYENYKAAVKALGRPEPGPYPNFGPNFLFVTEDPERDWPIVGPHVLYTTNSYAQWAQERGVGQTMYQLLESIEELKKQPIFQVVTPAQCVEFAKSLGPQGDLQIQPLFGGLDPKMAWNSLELFEKAVLPRLQSEGILSSAKAGGGR